MGFEQDKNIKYLIELAAGLKITLVIPEISFSESQRVLVSRIDLQKKLAKKLREEVKRSIIEYHSIIEKKLKAAELLEQISQDEEQGLNHALSLLSSSDFCKITPYTPEIHTRSYLTSLDKRYDLTEKDASIYESIKHFARECEWKDKKIFLTKDNDFNKPIILKELEKLDVEIYFKSRKAKNRIIELIG